MLSGPHIRTCLHGLEDTSASKQLSRLQLNIVQIRHRVAEMTEQKETAKESRGGRLGEGQGKGWLGFTVSPPGTNVIRGPIGTR